MSLQRFFEKNRDLVKKIKKISKKFGLDLENWERYPTYKKIKNDISKLDLAKMQVPEISAGEYWRENFTFKSYNSLNFPEYDICKTININQKFDLIIADNVWEHIKYSHRATKNIFNLLNDGGYFLSIVPFMIRVHEVPIDCTRWTEDGLRIHLEECVFQLNNIFTNSWGNKSCVSANLRSDDTWARIWFFRSLKNDKKFPVQVWALAKK